MRVSGSAEECERAGRELQRAAAEVSRTAQALQRAEIAGWAGTSAQGWERMSSRRVAELEGLAHALGAFGLAVHEHAAGVEELQAGARRLTAQAADAGLVLDGQGWIRSVPLPEGGLPDLLREALQRQDSRRRVLAGVADLRERERALHERLMSALARVHDRPAAPVDQVDRADVDWLPTWSDAPSAVVSASQVVAERVKRLPSVLRNATGWTGVGFVVGLAVELQAGRDWDDAITKGVVVTGMALGGAAVAPAAAPAVLVIGAAGVVGYATGKVFDAYGHRLPWVEKPPAAPGVHRAPSSTAAPRPLPRRR